MRTLSVTPDTSAAQLDVAGIVCHDVRNPAQRNEVLVRKGAAVSASEVRALLERGISELHVAVPDPDDVDENAAAQRLAAAVAGPGVQVDAARFGQVSFRGAERGVLRVDQAALERANASPDVLLLTGEPDRLVERGMTLGVVKCAPVFMAERTLREVEQLPPVLEVTPFQSLRVGLVAPRERLRGGAFERAQTALGDALSWYGSRLETVVSTDATVEALASAYRELVAGHVELILAAGASGTDELDVVFEGLRAAGGRVDQIGIPAEPGTACWIGHAGDVPVLGLASCELFGQPGALDLILPRLHVGEALDSTLVQRLALGGLLLGPARIAPYHTSPTADS